MRTVIIVGMASPYRGSRQNAEIWGINNTWHHQPDVDRLYVFDDIENFDNPEQVEKYGETFYEAAKRLDVPVYHRSPIPGLPKSFSYPMDAVVRKLGRCYFTSSIAYALAHAIYEGVDHIILHSLITNPGMGEYTEQKPCLDYWIGYAQGRGIRVDVSSDSCLARAFPWQPNQYGYETKQEKNHGALLKSLMQNAHAVPLEVFNRNPKPQPEISLVN